MSNIRKCFVFDPDSETIASELQANKATACKHERNPCILRCGVEASVFRLPDTEWDDEDGHHTEAHYHFEGPWKVIPKEERLRWMEEVEHNEGQEANQDSG